MIRREDNDGIVRLVIDRPARRNAFDNATAKALGDALNAVAQDDGCKVLVIKGAGEIFSAGRDLKAEIEGRTDPPGDPRPGRQLGAHLPDAPPAVRAFGIGGARLCGGWRLHARHGLRLRTRRA